MGSQPARRIGEPRRDRVTERRHPGLGRQGGQPLVNTALALCQRQRLGQGRHLGQLTLPERGSIVDHPLAREGKRPVVFQWLPDGAKRPVQDFQRLERHGSLVDGGGQQIPQFGLAVEEHLTLVREVAKEGALGHTGTRGDPGGGGLIIATLAEQLDGCLLQALTRRFSAAGHFLVRLI